MPTPTAAFADQPVYSPWFTFATQAAGAVHVLASALYAAVAWLALLAWLVISDGPVPLVLLASPIVFFGLILVITALGLALIGLRWLWRCRGSLRLRRSVMLPFQTRARRDLF